jgi:hypothetical protein
MNQKFNRFRQVMIALVFIAAVEGFSSCEKYSYMPPAIDPNATWHFQADIQPIFSANCLTCHGAILSPDLRDGKSYLALTKGGYVLLPGESSKLYLQMTSSSHTSRSTDTEKLKVLYWINQGAKNN